MKKIVITREEIEQNHYRRDLAPLLCEKGAEAIEWKMQKTGNRRISWHFIDGVHTMVEDDEQEYLPCIKSGYKTIMTEDVATGNYIYREAQPQQKD